MFLPGSLKANTPNYSGVGTTNASILQIRKLKVWTGSSAAQTHKWSETRQSDSKA